LTDEGGGADDVLFLFEFTERDDRTAGWCELLVLAASRACFDDEDE